MPSMFICERKSAGMTMWTMGRLAGVASICVFWRRAAREWVRRAQKAPAGMAIMVWRSSGGKRPSM